MLRYLYTSLSLLYFNLSLAQNIDIQENINLSFVCNLDKNN